MLNLTKAIIEVIDKDNYEAKYMEFSMNTSYKYNGYHKLFGAALKDNGEQILEDIKLLNLDINQIINLLEFFNSFYFDSNKGYNKEKDDDKMIYYLSKLFMINFDKFIDFIKLKEDKSFYAPFYLYNVGEEFRKEFVLRISKDIKWFKGNLLENCLNWSVESFSRHEKFDKDERIKAYDNYCIDDNDLLYMYNDIKDYLNKCKIAKHVSSNNINAIINYNLIATDKFKDRAIELIKIYANLAFEINCENNTTYCLDSKLFKNILGINISDYVRPKSLKEIDFFEKIFSSSKYSMLKNDEE